MTQLSKLGLGLLVFRFIEHTHTHIR